MQSLKKSTRGSTFTGKVNLKTLLLISSKPLDLQFLTFHTTEKNSSTGVLGLKYYFWKIFGHCRCFD